MENIKEIIKENIKACIRIKPVLEDNNEELMYNKFEEHSVINLKSNEKFDFGTFSKHKTTL